MLDFRFLLINFGFWILDDGWWMKVVSYYNLLYYTIVHFSKSYIKNLPAAGKVRNWKLPVLEGGEIENYLSS